MDWNALKDKALDLGNKAMDKGLTALEKASSHTYEGLKKTAVSIKSGEEFDAAKSAPLLLVLVVGKEDALSKAVLARMPVIFKDVWIYSASLKVILAEEVPDLVAALGISEFPAAFVFRKGEQEKRFEGNAALEFVKCINLSRPKAEAAPVPEGMVDVLAQATAPVAPVPAAEAAPAPVPAPAAPEAPSISGTPLADLSAPASEVSAPQSEQPQTVS